MTLEQQIRVSIEDPTTTTTTLQKLLDTVDVLLDDADTERSAAYRPSPTAITQAQRLRAMRGHLLNKLDDIASQALIRKV